MNRLLCASIPLLLCSTLAHAASFAPHLSERQVKTGKYHIQQIEPTGSIDSPIEPVSYRLDQKVSAQSTKSSADECTARELADLPDDKLVDYLKSNETWCISHLYGDTNGLLVYSEHRYLIVSDALVEVSANYDPDSTDVRRLTNYIRSYRFNAFYYPDQFPITDNMRAAEELTINTFFDTVSLPSYTTSVHYWNISQVALYVDSTERVWLYHDHMGRMLAGVNGVDLANDPENYQWAVFGVLTATSRVVINHRDVYEPYMTSTPEWASLYRKIALDPLFREHDYNNANNAANSLTLLLVYLSLHDVVIPEVNHILNGGVDFDQIWFTMVINAKLFIPELCDTLVQNVCDTPELRAKVMDVALPNTFEYDDGKLIVYTPLPRDRINQLVTQLNEVKSTFFNLTGHTTPVPDDLNEVAHLYIYGSPTDYQTFQQYLFNLPTNNGGIYIEPWGSMFTFDRKPWESSLTLGELVRHEYGHYLASRYLIPGFWGQTEMYVTETGGERLTWFDEGIANIVAGGTQYQGVQVLHSVISPLSVSPLPTTREAVNATYSSPMIYSYGSIVLNYLIDSESPLLADLFDSLRNDSVVEYENVREQISQLSTAPFHQYIDNHAANMGSIVIPWIDTLYPDTKFLHHTSAVDVQSEYISVLDESVWCSESSSVEFKCEIDVTLTGDTQYDIKAQANALTERLALSDHSLNIRTSNCYANDRVVQCMGALRSTDIDFEEFPDFVVPDVVYDGEQISMFYGQLTSSFDDLDMHATFKVVRDLVGGVLYLEDDGEFVIVIWATHGELSFTYQAVSGSGVVSNVGTITIMLKHVTPPTAKNVSFEAFAGEKLYGNMDADGYGHRVFFEVLNPSQPNGTFEYVREEGIFEFTPNADFIGTVTYEYVASNEYDDISEPATITINVKAALPPTPTATNVHVEMIKGNKASGTMRGNGHGVGVTYEVVNQPSQTNGTFKYNGDTGSFEFTPNNDFVGTVKYDYVAVNTYGDRSNTATITIVIKAAPIQTPITSNPTSSGGSIHPIILLWLMVIVVIMRTRERIYVKM